MPTEGRVEKKWSGGSGTRAISGFQPAAGPYDLLVTGGHVIDPAQQINEVMDPAVTLGKVARLAPDIRGGPLETAEARKPMRTFLALVLLIPSVLAFGQRKVAPTWLHRYVPDIAEGPSDLTTPACHYKAIFGAGSPYERLPVTVARFGEVTVDAHGKCKAVSYPREEQIYVILAGKGILHYGSEAAPVRKDDFMYLPPTVAHTVANSSAEPLRLVVMGFKIPENVQLAPPSRLRIANMENEREQTVHGHPSSVLYKLMLGARTGTRDTIDSAYVVTSLFWMDFAPGGTNFPHHHPNAEEIYLVIDGQGQMVAGGGMNGVEGLHPAKAGDAYFFRQNCTVGFYNSRGGKAHILAVRSLLPFALNHQK